jgi:hypothetical protein
MWWRKERANHVVAYGVCGSCDGVWSVYTTVVAYGEGERMDFGTCVLWPLARARTSIAQLRRHLRMWRRCL